jgi:serine/threonine-protein kinase
MGETTSSEAGLASRLLSEQAFGKYTLIAKIGHGGMAEVFLAALSGPAGFTKLCVLKRLHPHLEEEPALIGMFLDEARLAARLNHPNVVQTYEVGDVEGLHFLTMEYLEGQSLARVLRHLRRLDQGLPLAVGVRLFVEVLDGMQYAHTLRDFDGTPLNVVHRDISPGNLFMTYDGQVKVLDFGIARAGTHLMETRAGQVKGKFAYIAPEQASPDGGHDQRADLWSIGVVMWEALAGQRLFKGESEIMTLHNALNSEIISLDHEHGVPEGLSAIVDRALSRDPDMRYQSAREMKEDLERFMQDEGLRASRGDVGSFVVELFARERDEQRRVLSAYMRGESPGQPMIPLTPQTGSGIQSVPGQPVPSEKKKWLPVLIVLLAALVGAAAAILGSGETDDPEPILARTDHRPAAPLHGEGGVGQQHGQGGSNMDHAGSGTPWEQLPGQPSTTETSMSEAGTTEMQTAMTTVGEPTTVPHVDTAMAVDTAMDTVDTSTMMRRRRSMRATMTDRETEMEAVMETATMAERGFLTIDSHPWAHVSLNGQRIGTTPVVRHALAAGSHDLVLTNPERGLRTPYRVNIQPGQVTTRRIALE